MAFVDLNVQYGSEANNRAMVDMAISLGFDALAFTHTVGKKLSPADTCAIKKVVLSQPPPPAATQLHCLRVQRDPACYFQQFTRINVPLDDQGAVPALNPTNPVLRSFDVVAVRPSTEKLFHAACMLGCLPPPILPESCAPFFPFICWRLVSVWFLFRCGLESLRVARFANRWH